MRALLSAMLGIWLAFGPAPAAADCVTTQNVADRILAESPDAEVTLYEGAKAQRITDGISSMVSATVTPGGSFLVATAPGSPTSYIVLFVGGCASNHGRFPAALVDRWLNGTPG